MAVSSNPVSVTSIQRCMELTTTAETAKHFYDRAKEAVAKMGLSELKILDDIKEFVEFTEAVNKKNSEIPWKGDGEELPSRVQLFQSSLAEKVAKHSADMLRDKKIDFYFAISDSSDFLRAYDLDEEKDKGTIDAMDKLFNAWLVQHNMLNKGGVVYELDADGKIKKDAAGNDVKADSEKLSQMIGNKVHGFAAYASDKIGGGATLSTKQAEFPEAQKTAEEKEEPRAESEHRVPSR